MAEENNNGVTLAHALATDLLKITEPDQSGGWISAAEAARVRTRAAMGWARMCSEQTDPIPTERVDEPITVSPSGLRSTYAPGHWLG